MVVQKYIVMLDESPTRQVFLAYDDMGRISNASSDLAFQYDSYRQAKAAIAAVRRVRRWPNARVLGVIVEADVHR